MKYKARKTVPGNESQVRSLELTTVAALHFCEGKLTECESDREEKLGDLI